MEEKSNLGLIIAGVSLTLVVILFIAFSPFTLINAGHRGVITNFGKVHDVVLGEGFHFISPFWSVNEYDVRTQKIETQADAASRDLQSVSANIALNFRVNPDTVQSLYQQTQGKYEATLIAPAIQESVKAATAQFTADELITKRAEVKEAMAMALRSRESMRYFIVEDVSIINFAFSESFNASIEKKVTAEQDALASKNKLEQTKYEAEQRVVQAQAEAEAIRIQAQAVTSQGGAEYVKLQWIEAWKAGGSKVPNVMADSNSNFLMNIQ